MGERGVGKLGKLGRCGSVTDSSFSLQLCHSVLIPWAWIALRGGGSRCRPSASPRYAWCSGP